MAFPGIYSHPSEIAAEAASRVAPEGPNLKRLFGVNRDDLYEIGKDLRGNLPGTLPGAAVNPRGSAAAESIMNPKNVQRILDVNAEAEKYPELVRGMDPWYVMTPYYQRMVELLGPERAAFEYRLQNTLMGMASPGSEVTTEIPRGSAAYFLHKQGRFPEFMQFMGVPAAQREAAGVPKDIIDVPGHMYHKTAQALPMDKFLRTGEFTMTTPKVPMYIEASGVPQTGFQTQTPVGDAHWSRAVGLADTRGAKTSKGKEVVPGGSVSNPEMTQLAPWWRDEIAKQLGIESVPAQARTWGAFSGQTGVTTPIGSPKLEMIADKIVETAQRLGVSPETARDMVMTGEARMGKAQGGIVDSAPEEAIKNTIKDPQAFRMLDMDLANLALMNQQMQPRRMAGGGKLRVMHGSTTKITPDVARSFDVTSDPAYALKRAGDKMDALNIQGPPVLNKFDVPEDKLLRMDETPYSAEQVNAMRKFWSKLPADTNMTGEQIYDLMTQNRQHYDTLMPGITKAADFAGYQRPATGTGGRDDWFRITNPEHIEMVKRMGGAVHKAEGGRVNIESGIDINREYNPFSVLEKPTYGSDVPSTTPSIDQQRYELTMKGRQEAENRRYRAQQGDALAGVDPTGTLAVADALSTVGKSIAAFPAYVAGNAFDWLRTGKMAGAQERGKAIDEWIAPKTQEGGELLQTIGEAGPAITGSSMGFGMHPNLWAHNPPTLAQMRAGLKLHGEKAAPVIKDIGAMANDRYLTGKMPGMVAPASPVTTWHGTPHNIEGNKFSNEKIGTGEGNQAFGYGHYSAGSKGVGENYRDTLSVDPNQASENIKNATLEKFLPNESRNVQEQIKGFLSGLGYYDDFKVTIMREGSDAFKAALLKEEPLLFSGGNLYKIDIPDQVVEKMLDWDKPLKDQSPHVQKALARIAPDQYGPDSPDYDPSETGGMIYQRVVSIANSKVSPEWIKKRDLLMKKVQVEGDSAMPELTEHLDKAPRADKLGSELLLKSGITGNKYLDGGSRGVGSGTHNFVVFDPKYAKFLEKNGEAIEQPKATPAKALAPANEQGFYSPTEAAALNLQRKSGNGQAFLNDILKGENVRPDEINAMGLDTFLKDKKNVTAAEVQDYIAQNKLGLGEARYGEIPNSPKAREIASMDIEETLKAGGVFDDDAQSALNDWKQANPNSRRANQLEALLEEKLAEAGDRRTVSEYLDSGSAQTDTTKFKQYSLPGGENYREVVLTLPTENRGLNFKELTELNRRVADQGYDLLNAEQNALVSRGGNEAMDMLQDFEDRLGVKTDDFMSKMTGGKEQYRSSHFDEPNILAHLRMSDRVTDGKKTLLVDEVQSDWHQAGREQGYKTKESDVAQKAYRDYAGDLEKRYVASIREEAPSIYLASDPADLENFVRKTVNQKSLKDMAKAFGEEDKYNGLYYDYNLEIGKNRQGVPNAPYKDDWYQLALRRAVKEAIDGGYDRVALPTGARVNERFSLTKQINEIHYSGSNLKAYDHNGNEVISQTGVRPEDLPSYVGKETANKLLEQPKQGTLRSLVGQDLEVGGEGNKEWYDKIYPNYLKKFGKKYGASFGTTGVEVPPDSKAAYQRLRQYEGSTEYINGRTTWSEFLAQHPEAAKDFTEPLHYMDITPAMRKEFKTGIHMKKGGKVSFADSLDAMRHELTKAK
jgi:hypothetical protein